jgi:hypothetical protein
LEELVKNLRHQMAPRQILSIDALHLGIKKYISMSF